MQSLNKRGRPPGAKNKVSEEIRQAFNLLLDDNLPRLSDWIDQVAKDDPKAAIDAILKLAEFVLPKLQRVHQEVETTQPKQFVIDMST